MCIFTYICKNFYIKSYICIIFHKFIYIYVYINVNMNIYKYYSYICIY